MNHGVWERTSGDGYHCRSLMFVHDLTSAIATACMQQLSQLSVACPEVGYWRMAILP